MQLATTITSKVGRPAGGKRLALSQWINSHGAFTMGQIARGMGWTLKDADNVIRRAINRKEIKVVRLANQHGCKRPVAVYARPNDETQDLSAVLSGWVR